VLERIRRGEMKGRRMSLVVSHFTPGVGGTITLLSDRDGDLVAESRRDVATGLPSDGLNGNQQPAIGPDGWIYFGQGARTNAGVPSGGGPADGPENGAVLRVRPDGGGREVVARGLRNAFDLAFTASGELFATDNGPDPSGPGPVAGALDELDAIVSGEDYGWPALNGFPPEGSGTVGPVATFSPSTSTDGLAIVPPGTLCGNEGDLVAAQFGSFTNPAIGRRLVLIDFKAPHAVTVTPIATGFGRPLDVVVGPDGDLWVADFSNAFFSPSSASIWHLARADADGDGVPDACPR
jgi:glucose/arabinose dehydrogenase